MCVDSLEMLRLSHWFHSYIIPYRPWPCSKFVRSENSGKCLRDNLPLICKISRLWSSSAEVARRLSWDHLSIKLHVKFIFPLSMLNTFLSSNSVCTWYCKSFLTKVGRKQTMLLVSPIYLGCDWKSVHDVAKRDMLTDWFMFSRLFKNTHSIIIWGWTCRKLLVQDSWRSAYMVTGKRG